MSARQLVLFMCVAEIVTLLPFAAFPTLVPSFIALWRLSNEQAGWIGGGYYLGYMLTVPFLAGLTDRIDARKVYLAGNLISAMGCLGFALLADGFWSAFFWRAITGIGLAGSYMPGLKALTDRLGTTQSSRAVVAYTASYSVGVGLSFFVVAEIATAISWPMAFIVAGAGPLLIAAIAYFALAPHQATATQAKRALLDFRPVFGNRAAMAYILGYAGHCFELLAQRNWVVAFLVFVLASHPQVGWLPGAAGIAAAMTLLGLPASILGNELALRLGRRRVVTALALISAAVAICVGLSAAGPLWLCLILVLAHGVTMTWGSGSLTAGTVAAARPEAQGATMALHSTLGFATSFLGPLAVGITLDYLGGAMDRQANARRQAQRHADRPAFAAQGSAVADQQAIVADKARTARRELQRQRALAAHRIARQHDQPVADPRRAGMQRHQAG